MNHPEPEWTAENMNKKKGDTNFEFCGWCEHASCGSCRYGCCLSTSCSLTKSYGLGRDVFWDTPCIVISLGKLDIQSIKFSKQREIAETESRKQRLLDQISQLETLFNLSKEIPPLPDNRNHDYYDVSEILYVFYESKWNKGTCVSGYRHQDGCVSYVLEDYSASKKGWGCGYGVPGVLKAWEYRYFKDNPGDFKAWLDLSDRKYNGEKLDLKAYAKALVCIKN